MQADLIHELQSNFPNPGNRILRKSGYFRDQHGIIDRYLRETENWKPHLENCRRFIKDRLRNINVPLVVLGSGWLLDFPEELIIDVQTTVYLVDIKHPPQIIKKFNGQKNIHFVTGDVTGGLIAFAYAERKKCNNEELAQRLLHFQLPAFTAGRVIFVSLNILSQLDALLCEFLKRKGNLNEEQCRLVRDHIQKDHLKLLQMNRHILITDFEEWNYSQSQSKSMMNLIDASFLPPPEEVWCWKFDHGGYYIDGKKTDMKVAAFSQLQKRLG